MQIYFHEKTARLSVVLLSALMFFSASNFVSAQKRATKVKPQAVKIDENIIAEPENPAMKKAWETGELPAPLSVPSSNTDEAAAILAQKVSVQSEESVSALLTALQMSGFFITKQDGSVFLAPPDNKGQGLTINGWEVASAAKMYGDKKTTSLLELNERLKSFPEFKTTEPAKKMLEDVRRTAENSENKYLRFWARFILEMGKNSAAQRKEANELIAVPESDEKIDAIQHLLLFRRLYGDIYTLSAQFMMQANGFSEVLPQTEKQNFPRFVGASFSNSNELFSSVEAENFQPNDFTENASQTADQSKIPCRMDGNAPIIMDAAATGISYGYGELMSYLQNFYRDTPTGTALEKAGKIQAVANAILAYAKFIQTYAALEITLAMDGEPPLIRTKNSVPGERKNLRANLRMNIGNWQMYNCIRMALNVSAGIDFATVNDGPLSDVGVTWHLNEGGAGDFYSNKTGVSGVEQIVGFTQNGARIQDKGTGTVGTNGKAVGSAVYGKTDSGGVTRIILEGSPQKNAKTSKAKPVMKKAVVRTTVKLKAGDLKADSVDVAGQAINGVSGLITMPTELLYRVSWASSGTLTVPVKDWEECTGGWTGTITVTRRYRKEQSDTTSGRLIEAITIKERNEKIVYKVTGEQDKSGGLVNGYFADANLVYDESSFAKNIYQGSIDCRSRSLPNMVETKTYEQKASAKADGRVTVYISAYSQNGSLDAPGSILAVGEKLYAQTYKTGCATHDFTNTKPWYKDSSPFNHSGSGLYVDIEVDMKNPDVLSGAKTVPESDGSFTTYEWNLTYCR